MSRAPHQEVVTELFRDGVRAIATISEELPPDAWGHAACGSWTARETARHVLGVIGWYHAWLDRAEAGESAPPFSVADLPARNQRTLRQLVDISAADAIATFEAEADRYLTRASDEWDRPYGYPGGTVTVGLHCGVAAAEWHLHADDLSRLGPQRHEPTRPDQLLLATTRCLARSTGGFKGWMLPRIDPLLARRDPWGTMKRRAGRGD